MADKTGLQAVADRQAIADQILPLLPGNGPHRP